MNRLMISLVTLMIATGPAMTSAASPQASDPSETKYVNFQIMTGLPGFSGPRPARGQFSLSKAQLEEFVHSLVKAIGITGDARHKLGFTVGPLCFDMPDEETRRFIRDAFAVARENDVAVAFHIDDSICWGERKDLLSNPDNVETADWKQRPSTGRRADWGRTPTKFPPQMCFNSPEIRAAVRARASLIGTEVKKEWETLKASGKGHLFAGVIAGWETQIGRDFETDRALGYRALSHRGFGESNPPKDPDLERVQVVKEFIELWASSLHASGVPVEKIYCHIAFTSQGLRAEDAKQSFAERVAFALPEVAFSSAYRPGFSTYPEGATFKEIDAVLARHGSPRWISAEGVNVSPGGMPGEPTMETYLGRMFNHGAVMTNIFSWGMGGEAMRDNFFRRATENPEALAAYGKFLRRETLAETASTGFSASNLQAKMRRIQTELPDWVQRSGQQAKVMPLAQKIDALMKDKQWRELDKVADEILALMSSPMKTGPAPAGFSVAAFQAKMRRLQEELPGWVQKSGQQVKVMPLTKKLDSLMKDGKYQDADKVADELLSLMRGNEKKGETRRIPDDERRHLLHELSGPFIISRTNVQGELKLSEDQKRQLREELMPYVRETATVFERLKETKGREREQAMQTHRQKSGERLWALLKKTLNGEQYKRLRQLELQHEGPGALLGRPEIAKEMKFTNDQRARLIGVVQELQKQLETLVREAQSRGNAQEILPKAVQVRKDYDVKIEAVLNDGQKKLWKAMRGQPFDVFTDN